MDQKITEITRGNTGNLCTFIIATAQFILDFTDKYDITYEPRTQLVLDYKLKV
jgi:hypothetical protein